MERLLRGGSRRFRLLVALLGALGVAVLAPSLAFANAAVGGQVTDASTGNGIGGATVTVFNGNTQTATAQTAADGTWTVGSLPNGSYDVEFSDAAGGYGTLWYNGETSQSSADQVTVSGTSALTVDGALQGDGIQGYLDDQNGHELAGIKVELLNSANAEVAETTTDRTGFYSFTGIPAGSYDVEFNPGAANSGYSTTYYGGSTPTAVAVQAGQTTYAINGQVSGGGNITGTVTNSAQTPLSGVSVEVYDLATDNYYYATTSNGTYSLNGLEPGSYVVLFQPGSSGNYVYQYYPGKADAASAQNVTITSGQTTSAVNATLATGATISGKVTSAATGAAVSGADVTVSDYGGGYPSYVGSANTYTASNGTWTISGLPTGTYQVEFLAPYPGGNYSDQYYNGVGANGVPTPISITTGSTTSNINAALTPGGQVSGTVTNGTTGKPAQGINVYAVDNGGNDFASTTTDSNGKYTLTGLSPSASYRIQFKPPYGDSLAEEFFGGGATLQEATPVAVTVGQTTQNIDETLSEGGSISGAVTIAATGYPLGQVEVMVTDDAGNEVFAYNGGETATEPDGTYKITNLAPGSYKVEFSTEGSLGFQYYRDASTLSAATPVTVSAGQDTAGIDAALTQGGTLTGRVTDANGQGVAESVVEIEDAQGNFLTDGFTDPNGNYSIPGIAPGTYYVEFEPSFRFYLSNYQVEYYAGSATLAGATPVTITAGGTTAGIDGVLTHPYATSPTTSTTPPVTVTAPSGTAARATAGPPTLFGGSLSGLGKGRPALKFRLASGVNGAPRLKSFKVKLPPGLAFVAGQLRRGVKVTGGGKVTEKIVGGQLIVTLGSRATALTAAIQAPALRATSTLEAKAAHKKDGMLRINVTVTLGNGSVHMLSFTVKNPA